MLIARATSTNGLDLIRLALEILERGSPVPAALRAHFDSVVVAARDLALDADHPPAVITPDVVKLAVEMRQQADLLESLRSVRGLDDVNRCQAGALLKSMERQPVYA